MEQQVRTRLRLLSCFAALAYAAVSVLGYVLYHSPLSRLSLAVSVVYLLTVVWRVVKNARPIDELLRRWIDTTFVLLVSAGLGVCTVLAIPVLYSIPPAFGVANALSAPGEIAGRAINSLIGDMNDFRTLSIFSGLVNCVLFSFLWLLALAGLRVVSRRTGPDAH